MQRERMLMNQVEVDPSEFEHLKPSHSQKVKNNIQSLAYQAKMKEHELKEKFAQTKADRKAAAKRYGKIYEADDLLLIFWKGFWNWHH